MKAIKDIFNNSITVTNLEEAVMQTKIFINMSKQQKMVFNEFKFIDSIDIYGKSFKCKQDTKSGKSVTNLEYYQYQLKQLLIN